MSFNLNRLVQPECGAPNPLVAAAQQIATRSTIPHQTIRSVGPAKSAPTDFSQEFVNMKSDRIASYNMPNGFDQQRQQSMIIDPPPLGPLGPSGSRNLQPQMMDAELLHGLIGGASRKVGTPSLSAGDQLETKYLNDVDSNSEVAELIPPMANVALNSKPFPDVDMQPILTSSSDTSTTKLNTTSVDATERTGAAARVAQEDAEMKYQDQKYQFSDQNPFIGQFVDPFAEGLRRLAQADVPSAMLLFEAAVQKQPENAVAWRRLGLAAAQNEMNTIAIKALTRCLSLDSMDLVARIEIAFCLANDLHRRDAWRHLIGWLTRHDKYKVIQASQKRYEQLERESVKENYDTDYSIIDKRSCYLRDLFLEAARMSPNDPDPDIQNCLGLLFNMRGEYDKAIDCYKAALNVRPNDSLLWNRLGVSLANENKSNEAIEAYQRALTISPGSIRTRYNMAISMIHLKQFNDAIKHLLQILNTQQAIKHIRDGRQELIYMTSQNIWKTLKTLAKFMLRPDLYPYIDERDVVKCNEKFLTSPLPSIF